MGIGAKSLADEDENDNIPKRKRVKSKKKTNFRGAFLVSSGIMVSGCY